MKRAINIIQIISLLGLITAELVADIRIDTVWQGTSPVGILLFKDGSSSCAQETIIPATVPLKALFLQDTAGKIQVRSVNVASTPTSGTPFALAAGSTYSLNVNSVPGGAVQWGTSVAAEVATTDITLKLNLQYPQAIAISFLKNNSTTQYEEKIIIPAGAPLTALLLPASIKGMKVKTIPSAGGVASKIKVTFVEGGSYILATDALDGMLSCVPVVNSSTSTGSGAVTRGRA